MMKTFTDEEMGRLLATTQSYSGFLGDALP